MKQNGKHTGQHIATLSTNYSDYEAEIVRRNPDAVSTKIEPVMLELIETGFSTLREIRRELEARTIFGKIDYAHLNAAAERLINDNLVRTEERNVWTICFYRTDKPSNLPKRNKAEFVQKVKDETKFGRGKGSNPNSHRWARTRQEAA